MKTIFLFVFVFFFISTHEVKKQDTKFIYYCTKFPWYVFFDSNNVDCNYVEIGGIKYGFIDKLTKINSNDTISKSKIGILFYKNKELFYYNKVLKQEFLLKKVNYKFSFSSKRYKIFNTNAFYKSQSYLLNEKLKKDFYNIVKSDFEYFESNKMSNCVNFNFENFLINQK